MRKVYLTIVVLGIIISCSLKEKNQVDTNDFAAYGLLTEELQTLKALVREQINDELAEEYPEGTNTHLIYDSLTIDYISFLEITSKTLLEKVDFDIPPDYSGDFSNPKFINDYFFDEQYYNPEAVEFVRKTNEYRTEILKLVKDKNLATKIEYILLTKDPQIRNGEKTKYLNYYYRDIPLIGVLAYLNFKMTSILELEVEYLKNLQMK